MEIRDSGRGFKFACDPGQHATWFTFQDEQEVRDRYWHPPAGSVILDVGCGFGSYMLPALASGSVRAYGWTPLQNEIDMLRASLLANGWEGSAVLFRSALHGGEGHVNPDTNEFRPDPFPGSYPTVKLDDFAGEMDLSGECWMKLDVEGSEVDVLRGASEIISGRRPVILVEGHEFHRPGITGEVASLLAGHGYRMDSSAPYHGVIHALFLP